MSEYTQEQFDQLPDFVKDNLEKVGEVYKDKGLLKVKATADELNNKLNERDSKLTELNERLTRFEQEQEDKIKQARKDALEQARSKGDVEAIEKRYQEQMEDLEKRTAERVRNETLREVSEQRASEKADSLTSSIASKIAVDDDAEPVLVELLRKRVTIDPNTQKAVFLNDDGSASSLSESDFVAEVKKSPRFKHLVKGEVKTTGGGLTTQNGKGSAAPEGNLNRLQQRKARVDAIKEKYGYES